MLLQGALVFSVALCGKRSVLQLTHPGANTIKKDDAIHQGWLARPGKIQKADAERESYLTRDYLAISGRNVAGEILLNGGPEANGFSFGCVKTFVYNAGDGNATILLGGPLVGLDSLRINA